MKTVFKLWVEWELGQDDVVFSTEQKAWQWLNERLPDVDIEESVEELIEGSLAGVEELNFL